MAPSHSQTVEAGQAALGRGDWARARDAFEGALASRETGEALEGLGWALWWLDETDTSFAMRERAYRTYIAERNSAHAARVATALAIDIYDYQGEVVASGWLARARSHLEGLGTTAERGWLELWEGHFVRLARGDIAASRRHGERALEIARELGVRDLELLAMGLEGHALVSEGQVEEGMRRLDEATAAALAGEISSLDAAGVACCFLMHACEQARDYGRAAAWADRVAEFSRRWSIRPLYAICRVHYAAVLTGRGAWVEAEAELERSLAELGEKRGPARNEATLFLGELRRRQGRHDEASALFSDVEGMSLALYGRAAIAFDAGHVSSAITLLERALRRVAIDNWTVRTTVLDLLARAHVAAGNRQEAAEALETLQNIAGLVGTHHARGLSRHATGVWLRAEGDLDGARRALEDAIDHFHEAPAPYESHRLRLDLAEVLAATGHAELAAREARVAREGFERLGAEGDGARAATLERDLAAHGAETPDAGARPRPADGPLSPREAEVLRHVAEGLGDRAIAERLHLSEHTVHRHVSNIMSKLEVPSRAAAVAQALRRGLI